MGRKRSMRIACDFCRAQSIPFYIDWKRCADVCADFFKFFFVFFGCKLSTTSFFNDNFVVFRIDFFSPRIFLTKVNGKIDFSVLKVDPELQPSRFENIDYYSHSSANRSILCSTFANTKKTFFYPKYVVENEQTLHFFETNYLLGFVPVESFFFLISTKTNLCSIANSFVITRDRCMRISIFKTNCFFIIILFLCV